MKSIACILINYRFPEDTLACLRSLSASGAEAFKVFLVNNFPGDGSGAPLQAYLRESGMAFRYFEPGENLGYTGGMNLGIEAALAEDIPTVLVLNNDTVLAPDFSAQALAAVRAHPDEVIAGCVLDSETGRPSHNIGRLSPWTGLVRDIFDRGYSGDIDFVSGCMMFVPAKVFRAVGLFDDRYFMYREDFDFCLRLRDHKVGIRYVPSIVVEHKVSSSTDRTGTPKEYYRMRNQTHILLERGPIPQKSLYFLFIMCLLAFKLRHPRVFLQFLRGIRDALAGKLGR